MSFFASHFKNATVFAKTQISNEKKWNKGKTDKAKINYTKAVMCTVPQLNNNKDTFARNFYIRLKVLDVKVLPAASSKMVKQFTYLLTYTPHGYCVYL